MSNSGSGSNKDNPIKSGEGSAVKPTKSNESASGSRVSTRFQGVEKKKSNSTLETKSKSGTQLKSTASSESKSKVGLLVKSINSTEVKGKRSAVKSKQSLNTKSKSITIEVCNKKDSKKEVPGSSEYANARSVLSKKDGPDVMETDKAVLKAGPVKVISDIRIGFVGGGKMTEAIIKGLLKHAKVIQKQIFVAAKTNRNLDYFKSEYKVTTSTRMYDIFGYFDCDLIFLCIHGFVVRACYKNGGIRPMALATNYIPNNKHPLTIHSLVGGVSLDEIKQTLLDPDNPKKYIIKMHRIVLNTCVANCFGLGVIDVDGDSKDLDICSKLILSLLNKYTLYQPEQLMDAICTLCGNGLAFVYYFINAMCEGGLKIGLEKEFGIKLVSKVLLSATVCIEKSDKELNVLQDWVLSKGGPAIYGIDVLNKSNCDAGFQDAIEASYRRLKELANVDPSDIGKTV